MQRHNHNGMSYLRAGDGKPILMLHGIPGSAYAWQDVGLALADQGYTVIIPDLMGLGESQATAPDFYMEDQAHALASLLKALDIGSCVLALHDFGGPVGVTLMRLYPELKVNALVITNTNLFTDTPVPLPLRVAAIPVLGKMFYDLAVGTRGGIRMLYRTALKQKETVPWSTFQRHLTPNGLRATSNTFHRSIRDLAGNYRAVEDKLPTLKMPTLVLWAEDDPLFAVDSGRRVAEQIPNASLKTYPHTGHFVPEEQPAQVTQDILRLLEKI
ncbi:MAG: alpha/beta hydrolase [Chloroflexi bacterium]|nr:alpha/beta hydrolase [Chloroflexota bacterium]